MKRQLVFLPIAATEMGALSGNPRLTGRVAYTVTAELIDELGYEPGAQEEAEHASLVLASVAGLAMYGKRLVLVAEVAPALIAPGMDSANGQVVLDACPPSAMIAWFEDAPEVDVADAAAAAKNLSLDEAWQQPQVQALLQHDLLWNDVIEYRRGM